MLQDDIINLIVEEFNRDPTIRHLTLYNANLDCNLEEKFPVVLMRIFESVKLLLDKGASKSSILVIFSPALAEMMFKKPVVKKSGKIFAGVHNGWKIYSDIDASEKIEVFSDVGKVVLWLKNLTISS